jgi:hypothetical protein
VLGHVQRHEPALAVCVVTPKIQDFRPLHSDIQGNNCSGFRGHRTFVKLEHTTGEIVEAKSRMVLPSFSRLIRMSPMLVVSSMIGIFIGVVPAAGNTAAPMAAYGRKRDFPKKLKNTELGLLKDVLPERQPTMQR